MFTKAIVKQPGTSFADGLTSVDLGTTRLRARTRTARAYCEALESCGLEVIRLPPDENYPDSTFVEDTAVLTARGAIITRPGADSRRGEIDAIEPVLRRYFQRVSFDSRTRNSRWR